MTVAAVDLTDVPIVSPQDLTQAVRVLASAGIPLITSRHTSEERIRAVEAVFWQHFDGPRELKTAILLRIRALSEVLGSRRLGEFVSSHHPAMLRMTLKTASTMRLNTKWGFNPAKFMFALTSVIGKARPATITTQQQPSSIRLAA